MKHILMGSLLALALVGCEQATQHPEDLPWQASMTPEGTVQAFHLEIGKSTLKETINQFRSFPEIAVFTQENGKRRAEAYFGKQRLGVFEAKIIAELQADDATLAKFEADSKKREGMASGMWKYALSEDDVRVADGLPVRKLVYMPTIDYDPETVTARFGEPTERLPSQKEGVEFWFYPQKGLAILMNNDGDEILYYTDEKNYPALKQDLLEAIPKNAD